MAKKKVAIIGSGIAGLSSAIYLSKYDVEIHVYEKNEHAGGKANYIKEKGFRFDKGPSLLTMPFVIENLFKEVNENIDEYLKIEKLKIYCKYFWNDGTIINAYSDLIKFKDEIKKVSSEDAQNIDRFLNYSQNIYKLTADLFLFKSFSEINTFLNYQALKTLINLPKIDPFRSMHKSISDYFSNEKIVQLFDRYATYNGSNPFKAPATLNIISHVEYNLGGYILKDGIYSLIESLYKLALKRNIVFHFNTEVKKIIVHEEKAKGLLVNFNNEDEIENYEIIISNSDVNYTYEKLIGNSNLKNAIRYKKLELSSSALVFYWGVEGIQENLEIHNILFSNNYKKEFDYIFENKNIYEDPTIYIYISSKFKDDDSPKGFENWFVMINAPVHSNQNWDKIANDVREIIIKKIHAILKINLREKIVYEKILTPVDLERETFSNRGSLYGISSNNRNAAFLRQQNRSSEINGLYFCGGSAHPGGGIPLTILSGKITADLIKKYELSYD